MGRSQFGSMRKLPSGRWQARYRTPDGRRVSAPDTFPTKAAAGLWLAVARKDLATGIRWDPDAGRVKLKAYAWAWLEHRTGLAPRTREMYANQLANHVLPPAAPGSPVLGEVFLVDVTPDMVRAWYKGLQRNRGDSVAAKAYVRLRQILSQAVDDDLILKNPCKIERGGAERHPEQRFVTLSELFRLAETIDRRYRAMVLVAGLAGLRLGELCALRGKDVDLDAGSITVQRKRVHLASGEVVEGAPKTRAGRRDVAIPKALVEELQAHMEELDIQPDGYVFTSSQGQPIDANNFRHRIWRRATSECGLTGLRFHDLRHTAGTLAAQTGATTKELMVRLGHASASAAMVYQHAAADRDRDIAQRLDEMIENAAVRPGPG